MFPLEYVFFPDLFYLISCNQIQVSISSVLNEFNSTETHRLWSCVSRQMVDSLSLICCVWKSAQSWQVLSCENSNSNCSEFASDHEFTVNTDFHHFSPIKSIIVPQLPYTSTLRYIQVVCMCQNRLMTLKNCFKKTLTFLPMHIEQSCHFYNVNINVQQAPSCRLSLCCIVLCFMMWVPMWRNVGALLLCLNHASCSFLLGHMFALH